MVLQYESLDVLFCQAIANTWYFYTWEVSFNVRGCPAFCLAADYQEIRECQWAVDDWRIYWLDFEEADEFHRFAADFQRALSWYDEVQ